MGFLKRLCALWMVAGSFLLFGQTLERGAVRGNVYDSSQAIIPNAKVTLSNTSTGFRREVTTGSEGTYAFESVPPGEYTLTAERDGFALTTVKEIQVSVGSSVSLDVKMPP